ncbi:MAG: fibronectin type III domain-containing protein [Desulfobacterales bacterium]|nr:fibronectin type III domain-containing protein [Desulfobacterales bacterium]
MVDFGTDTSYGSTQGNSADSTTSHSVVLTGLASETTYYYRVKSMDVSGNTAIDDNSSTGYTFLTTAAPDPGDTTAPVISSVSSSSIASTGATIVWTTDENSDSTVGFSLNTSFDQEQGSTTATTAHSIALVNLAPETTYYYQIKSRDSGGNLGTDNNSGAGYSLTTLAGGDALAPIISDVTISDITANTAKVTWTTNENSNSLVDYSRTSGVFTSTAGKYQDNTTTHSVTLTGLDPSTAYYLQARSADASGNEGKDSNGGTGWTFTTTAGGDETPPEITDISAGTPTYNSVTITWTTNELSNSLVDFGTTTSYGTTQGNSADSVTSHSVTLTGLSPSTAYYYRVKSIDVSGNLISDDNSGNGHTFTTAAGADPGDTTAPVITFDSGAGITNVTSNSATIAWTTDESSDSIIGYSLDTSFNSEKGSATLTTSHSVTLTNLSSGTAYKFQIKSMDASGNLATENNSGVGYTFTTLAGGDSTAPIITNVASGTCTDTTATITWTTDENSSSLVDYGTVLGTYLSTGGNYKASVTAHSVTLNGLTAETTYYYRVRSIDANDNQALDSGGSSGYSFTTTAATESECPDCPSCGGGGGSCPSIDSNPPTISNVKISEITTNSALVKWETNEKSYSLVEYGLDSSYDSTNGSATANTTNHTVALTKLDENTTYHYSVLSADSSGNLAQSEDFTFKTVTFDELTPEEQEEQTQELNETTATEIQTKIEELLTQGIDEEEIRIIIARASEPPVISTEGPIVENVTNNSAKVVWITDRKSNSVIRFKTKEEGVDPETSSSLKQYGNFKELAVEHQVILASLHSGTSYQYQVQSSDVLGNTSKSDWNEFSTEITPSIYDVIISEITLNSAVISWKTNVVTSSKVEYGKSINYTNSAEDKGLSKVAKHSIKLNNLKSGTLYHFRVRGMDGEGNSLVSDDYSFTTFTLPQIETYQIEEIAERTVKLNWKTNVETDSTLKYTDLETNITKTQGEDGMSSIHNFTLKGLNPGKEYLLQIQGRDIYGNRAITSEFTATTLADNTAPEIKQIRTETAVSSGKSDVVQTIISWKTSEPATSQILWEEGISQDKEPKNATKEDENYTTNHITVITTFKPASVYRFRIQGKDKAGNIAQSQDFTILIPEKKKSVIQIIISNFENTFGWVKKIGL